MEYNEIAIKAKQKNVTVESVAIAIGMKTRQGLQSSMESKKMQWRYIEALCKYFDITPNEFFGWPNEMMGSGNYASNISGGNTQNSNDSIKAMREQLKEKDKQISRLLSLLEKANLHTQGGNGYGSIAAEVPAGYKNGKGKK